ncbi:nucleolar and spindle-associated protein 1 isoform X2 [Ambystoma mexicanum]|uniref:nucleolar and spindle-associated protein 1 isoform X2 n=1 Tax=Ambystoma mexicanum TaxID=8296 RepID=UPI0037E9C83A
MEVPTVQELDSLKYSDLQRLAKSAGLKANLKGDKLLKSLKQHFLHEPKGEHVDQDTESSQSSFTLTDEDDLNSSQEKEHLQLAHVTKRRGRGHKANKSASSPKEEPNVNRTNTNVAPLSEVKQEASFEDQEKSKCEGAATGKQSRKRTRPEDCTDEQRTLEDFKKLHEAHFKKMESIDTFVERHKKRLEAHSNPKQILKLTLPAKKENIDPKITHSGIAEKQKFTSNFKAEQMIAEDTLNKPIDKNPFHGNSVDVATPNAKVPPYARRLSRAGDSGLKATTPNLKKIKDSHFEKMALFDEYVSRKKERLNAITNSIQEVKMLAEKKHFLKQVSGKVPVSNLKKNVDRASLFSPVPSRARHSIACTPGSQRRSPRTSVNFANASLLPQKSAFRPSVLSSSKLNVRFSETTKDNEHKQSLIKTPARRSPFVQIETDTPSNPIRKSLGKSTKAESTLERRKTGDFTPFKFMGDKPETPGTNKKSNFDIKASLAKPLGYEPHKGKLKPWGEGNEIPATLTKSVNRSLCILKKEYKQPRLQTRETRRDEHVKGRKNKKDEMIGTRRGLIMT